MDNKKLKEKSKKKWKQPSLLDLKKVNTKGGTNPQYTEDFTFNPGS